MVCGSVATNTVVQSGSCATLLQPEYLYRRLNTKARGQGANHSWAELYHGIFHRCVDPIPVWLYSLPAYCYSDSFSAPGLPSAHLSEYGVLSAHLSVPEGLSAYLSVSEVLSAHLSVPEVLSAHLVVDVTPLRQFIRAGGGVGSTVR